MISDNGRAGKWPFGQPQPASAHAERLTETIRLAMEGYDECARADIESYCAQVPEAIDGWYSTLPRDGQEPFERRAIERAVRYLTLRDRITVHESEAHLVKVNLE